MDWESPLFVNYEVAFPVHFAIKMPDKTYKSQSAELQFPLKFLKLYSKYRKRYCS